VNRRAPDPTIWAVDDVGGGRVATGSGRIEFVKNCVRRRRSVHAYRLHAGVRRRLCL
jgi:hypothetical protein